MAVVPIAWTSFGVYTNVSLVALAPPGIFDAEWQTDPVPLTAANPPQIFDGQWVSNNVALVVVVY